MLSFIVPDLRRLETANSDLIALYQFEELAPLRGITSLVDWRLHGHLSRVAIEGFFTGSPETPLLMPLGRLLPQQFLLLIGLGKREAFSDRIFKTSLERTFDITEDLHVDAVTMALPGRVEKETPSSDAIDWFIDVYSQKAIRREVTIVEPLGAQKAMLPAIERWRLRSLVPEN